MDRDSQGNLQESRRSFSDDRTLKIAQKFACRGAIVAVSSLILSSVFGYLAIGKIAKCDRADCLSLKARTNCKAAAIVLFTVGLCIGLVCLCLHKKMSRELRKRKTVVVISSVTELGLLKSPAPKLAHCTAGCTDADTENVEFQDLPPEYAAVDSLCIGSGVTVPDIEAAVALSLDEDFVNPPPSYEEALELMAMHQKRLEQ